MDIMDIAELFKILFYDNTEWDEDPLYDIEDEPVPDTPKTVTRKHTVIGIPTAIHYTTPILHEE